VTLVLVSVNTHIRTIPLQQIIVACYFALMDFILSSQWILYTICDVVKAKIKKNRELKTSKIEVIEKNVSEQDNTVQPIVKQDDTTTPTTVVDLEQQNAPNTSGLTNTVHLIQQHTPDQQQQTILFYNTGVTNKLVSLLVPITMLSSLYVVHSISTRIQPKNYIQLDIDTTHSVGARRLLQSASNSDVFPADDYWPLIGWQKIAGYVIGSLSTAIYAASRIPQMCKNVC